MRSLLMTLALVLFLGEISAATPAPVGAHPNIECQAEIFVGSATDPKLRKTLSDWSNHEPKLGWSLKLLGFEGVDIILTPYLVDPEIFHTQPISIVITDHVSNVSFESLSAWFEDPERARKKFLHYRYVRNPQQPEQKTTFDLTCQQD